MAEVQQGKFVEFISPAKVILDERAKQNISPISPTPKLNLGIVQILIKNLQTILVLSSIKILICTIPISDHSFPPRGQECV